MAATKEELDTVLVVDDELPVRTTFREWLEGSALGVRVLAAADAEEALKLANQYPIDLAVLDWNLGAGNDGLHLLQDLAFFHPDIVAILVTGYAQQATPLDAMRMGVRDYLDKNQDLNRDSFLAIVRNQMARIRPAKRSAACTATWRLFARPSPRCFPSCNSPRSSPIRCRCQPRSAACFGSCWKPPGRPTAFFWCAATMPTRIRRKNAGSTIATAPCSTCGRSLSPIPWPAAVSGMQAARVWQRSANQADDGFLLQPFEEKRNSILAAPMAVAPGVQAVLELFDKTGGFSPADVRVAAVGVDLGADLLRQALAERVSQRTLFDAVEAALGASEAIAGALTETGSVPTEQTPGDAALRSLREGLRSVAAGDSRDTLKLLQTVRDLALAHGPEALRHCLRIVESTAALLAADGGVEAKS